MKKVKIYTTPTCVYCHLAKDFFKENDVSYQEFDVFSDLSARKEMIEKSGQMGVPVIDVDGEIIIGFERGKLKQLLGLK